MLSQLLEYLAAKNPADLARDGLDVLITYYIFYRVALVLRGTRAIQIGVGLALVFILYVVAQLLRLNTVLTLLSAVLSSAILIGVVVFQNDIRRGLMRVGSRARIGSSQTLEAQVIDDVVEAATTLARHRTGAIITFEQEANLDEFVGSHTGLPIDAAVSPELMVSLFIPEGMNKLHDGAVIIRDLRIAKAGVFFPMPETKVTDESFGSRHRAALGITEETDAVVVVVSEERGSISFCFNGNIVANLDGPRLKAALEGVFTPLRKKPKARQGFWARWLKKTPTSTDRATLPPASRKTKTEVLVSDEEPKPLRKKTDEPQKTAEDKPAQRKSGEREGRESSPAPLRKSVDRDSNAEAVRGSDRESKAELTPLRQHAKNAATSPSAEESPKPLRRGEPNESKSANTPAKAERDGEPRRLSTSEVVPTPLRHLAVVPTPEKDSEPTKEERASLEHSRPMPRAKEKEKEDPGPLDDNPEASGTEP